MGKLVVAKQCRCSEFAIMSPLYSSQTIAAVPRETSLSETEIFCAPVVLLLKGEVNHTSPR